MLEVDKKTFEDEVLKAEGYVFVDFFGDGCVPCQALMPFVHEMADKYGDKIKFTSLNTTKARRLAIGQKILGLPVMAIYRDGEKVEEEVKEEEKGIDIEPKDEITFEEFGKMQFQVGEIISCEAVKKSKKLLCSQVKIGSQVKQIVSGIKAHYTPEEMVGKKVMVLVNLKPAKLAGVLSEGMLLCAEDENGELSLMVPEKKMPSGAEIC